MLSKIFNISLLFSAVAAHAFGGGDHPVQAHLVADVETIAPGQPFHLGVLMRMEKGWHTYWKFSGEAGLPTDVQWGMPDNFVAGELQWPLPHKYDEQGLVTYGYADENLLLAQVTPPARLAADTSLVIEAAVSWLVCRETCIPGGAQLALTLPVGSAAVANAEIFDRYRAMVPGSLGADVELDYAAAERADGVELDISLRGLDKVLEFDEHYPDFYPFDAADFTFKKIRRKSQGDTAQLHLQLAPYGDESIETLRGVLTYRLVGEQRVRAGEVALDLSAAKVAKVEAGGKLLEMEFKLADAEQGSTSLGVYLLLAALGGLILNLMPCVLPVISLKVLSFVSQAGEEKGRIRQLGLVFSAGIVATFLALAALIVLLKAGGEQIGWGFQFQYPGFVVAMAALVFALALSLFGLFAVRLPGVQGGAGDGEGLSSSFFNGVLATILATPCTAPFLGTALGFAFTRSAWIIWSVFLSIGLGMALPYVVLALQPGWMRFVPRPGPWMEHFKQLMGFLLMATVLWLLWVLGKQVGMEGVIWTGGFLLCLALACWIIGQWVDLRSSRRQRLLAWAAALAVVAAAYGLLLDPLLAADRVLAQVETESDEVWLPFSTAGVEELIAADRHIFIDFTADWCLTCKVNERTVLADEAVRAKFAEMHVALVKADWTNGNAEISQLLRAFGRSGVPLYVILPKGRADEPMVLPEVITSGIVLENLEAASRAKPQPGD